VATIYSRVLLAEAGFIGEAALEIPDGFVCVVRDIDLVYGIAVGLTAWAYDTSGIKFWGVVVSGDHTFTTVSWRGRQVIPGPGFVYLSTNAACDFRMSGYLLTAA
jgi:hypothetical protein